MSMRNFADFTQSAISSFFEAAARSHEAMFAAWAAIEGDLYRLEDNEKEQAVINVTEINVPDFVDPPENSE